MNFNFTNLDTTKPLTQEQFESFEFAFCYMQAGITIGGNPFGRNSHAATVIRNRAKTRIGIGI